MKILFLCKKYPYPPKDGEAIAIFSLIKELAHAGHELTVLSIVTHKHPGDPNDLPTQIRAMAKFVNIFVDTRIKVANALHNLLFTRESYNIARFKSKAYADALTSLLKTEKYDIIQLEGVFMSSYLPLVRQFGGAAPVIMRAHNVEFEIWERLAASAKNPLKKLYLNLLAKRMRRFELGCLNSYDGLAPITSRDGEMFKQLGCQLPMYVLPAGADLSRLLPNVEKLEYPSVFHLGSMDWLPNQEGVEWFLKEVWPGLHAAHPTWRFYIAGRNMPEHFLKIQQAGVTVCGEVLDAVDFMNEKAVMIVPLLSGGGMRVKLVEGLALGKTVVSTSVGAEGVPAQHRTHLLLADGAKAFGDAVEECLTNRIFFENIGKNARTFAIETFDNKKLVEGLLVFYKSLTPP